MYTTASGDAAPGPATAARRAGDGRLPSGEGGAPAVVRGRGRNRQAARSVHFHDPHAPAATAVVPSVFVAVRNPLGHLLLVRRCDSGTWELPGGRVDVGESAVTAAVRETAEESGVQAEIIGLVGVYTDPAHVVRAADGSVRQPFVVVFRAHVVGGTLAADGFETCEARWVAPRHVRRMRVEAPARRWIDDALHTDVPPRLA
jgi:ADP-ribose pyrophosphatase YjhB (NUDIX family)